MITQTAGKIYLAEDRGKHELDWFRSYHTFNFGQYQEIHKQPLGALYLHNDDTLAGGAQFSLTVEEATCMVILPVVGAITWQLSTGEEGELEAGQAVAISVAAGTSISITNPYSEELVNILQWWFRLVEAPVRSDIHISQFDIDGKKNELVELFTETPAQGHTLRHYIGKFDGRAEELLRVQPPNNGVFVSVVIGAFEVQNRLLHPRDGLALWGLEEMELEALSNEAILFCTVLPIPQD